MPDAESWRAYRTRVEQDHPNYRFVRFHRAIEPILERYAAIDGEIADLVRPLTTDEFSALHGVLQMLGARQAAELGIGPDRDYGQWYTDFVAALGAGRVDFDGWRPAERMASLMSVSERALGLRQVAPQPEGATLPAQVAPARAHTPEIVAATGELLPRFQALVARVAPGTAGPEIDAELEALLAEHRALAERCPPGSLDRAHVDFAIGMVLGQLGRSAAMQGAGRRAAEWFAASVDVWRSLGEPDRVLDCVRRAAAALMAADGDVDRALEQALSELDRLPAAPSVFRARLLAEIGSVLAHAGDPFDAATRIRESADALDALDFPDPTQLGGEAAFAAWIVSDHREGATHAMMSAVATLWASITETRIALGPADRMRSGAGVSEARLTDVLGEVAAVSDRLGTEANMVGRRLEAEGHALGMGAGPRDEQDTTAGEREDDGQAVLRQAREIAGELIRLHDEFDAAGDEASVHSILERTTGLERQASAIGLPALAATAALLRGDALSELGRFGECAEALTAARDALEHASGIADSERRTLLVRLLIRTVMAHTMNGEAAASSDAAEAGIAIAELDRGKASSPYLQDSYLRERRRLYDAGVFAAYRLDDPDLMLRRADLAKARGMLGWIAARHPEGNGGSIDDDAREVEAEFRALTARAAADPAAAERRHVLWTRLMAARTRRHAPAAIEPFSLAAVQRRLAREDAVVYHYWLTRTTLLIVTIDHQDVVVEKVDLQATRDELGALAADLAGLRTEVRWLEDEITPLGRLLMPRTGAALLEDKRRLLISPQGILHQLPFHAFDWEGEPLMGRFAVSYVPNLTSLLVDRPPQAGGNGVLALAVSSFANANPLVNAPREVAQVSSIYRRAGATVTTLVDAEATRERLEALRSSGRLREFRLLHLCTHGGSGPADEPFAAVLALADGEVDGLEISQWELHAELVVLSACCVGQRAITGRHAASTGATDSQGDGEALFGDEMFGLPAAFFSAGAREVLSALWPIKDEAALAIMPSMHEHLVDGQPGDEALALAVEAYRATEPNMYKWAPLKLVSVGRPAPNT